MKLNCYVSDLRLVPRLRNQAVLDLLQANCPDAQWLESMDYLMSSNSTKEITHSSTTAKGGPHETIIGREPMHPLEHCPDQG